MLIQTSLRSKHRSSVDVDSNPSVSSLIVRSQLCRDQNNHWHSAVFQRRYFDDIGCMFGFVFLLHLHLGAAPWCIHICLHLSALKWTKSPKPFAKCSPKLGTSATFTFGCTHCTLLYTNKRLPNIWGLDILVLNTCSHLSAPHSYVFVHRGVA